MDGKKDLKGRLVGMMVTKKVCTCPECGCEFEVEGGGDEGGEEEAEG